MIDVIKKTLLAGVGAAVVTKEKIEDSLEELVRKGKLSAADAKIVAEKIAEQGRREFEAATDGLSARLKDLFARTEDDTRVRLAALEERVRILETRLAEPPTRNGEP